MFYQCTKESVAICVATAALTGIMPSTGAAALAYVIPRRDRSGEPPNLKYELSHRGLNALAQRSGMHMQGIAISKNDVLETDEYGGVIVKHRDIDNPPQTHEELRGVMVIVRNIESGNVVATGFVSVKDIEKRRAMSESWKNERARPYSPWSTWPVEQCVKTALHYAIGRAWCVIDDAEAQRALALDVAADMSSGAHQTAPAANGKTLEATLVSHELGEADVDQSSQLSVVDTFSRDIGAAESSAEVDAILTEAWSDGSISAEDKARLKSEGDARKKQFE